MEYESNILKRLIDTYGVVGNPRYISEIIKEFIVQGKERYPELFTYQADWLAHIDEFGLNPSYTVSYTGQSIYAPNTLERSVKSAILKGQTLVNSRGNTVSSNGWSTTDGIEYIVEGNNSFLNFECTLLPNTKYLIFFEFDGRGVGVQYGTRPANGGWDSAYLTTTDGICKKAITTGSDSKWLSFIVPNSFTVTDYVKISRIMIIPYQDGMENWDIPYFEGMQSVKLPVLTTSNEDGTKTNILTVNEPVELRGIGDVQDTLDCLTGELVKNFGILYFDGSENWKIYNRTETMAIAKLNLPNLKHNFHINTSLADNIPVVSQAWTGMKGISLLNQDVYLAVEQSIANTNEDLKNWISSIGGINLIYRLSQSTVKTVDLTILDQNGQNVKQLMSFNGGTHFNTGSLEGSLIPSVSVTVETDLEETLKVCSLEGNTM